MRYLLMIQLKADSDQARIVRDVPQIINMLSSFSKGEHEVAYRAIGGHTFGYFFRSKDDPSPLRLMLPATRFFLTGDSVMVIEVGEIKVGVGASRAWTWLQHHP